MKLRPTGAGMAAALALALASCSAPDTRPSVLLFVFDTTRVDAVSAYGAVAGTTPELDRLASSGLRYQHAYANAPWTLPSHATLFTGLLPHQHGVGYRGVRAPDSLVMLAERLRDAGYETAAFSENPFVSETFNMMQGFETLDNDRGERPIADVRDPAPGQYNVQELVAAWAQQRKRGRPFFLFVNVMNAHEPYPIRAENPFVPRGVDARALQGLNRKVHKRICAALPPPKQIEALKGLYLGGVAADDAKLRAVLGALRDAGASQRLVTIVTADHGEHFGEHRLMEHNFSVREALLHVPLVISGAPGAAPAVIDQPVQLADVVPSVLRWVGAPVPADLPGRPLPTEASTTQVARDIVAEYTEPDNIADAPDQPDWLREAHAEIQATRSVCTAQDRVFGNMLALVRYPFKLIWFERYPAELYDLSSDPEERSDLSTARPELAAKMHAEVEALIAQAPGAPAPAPEATVPPEVRERLRALGYIGGATPAAGSTPLSE